MTVETETYLVCDGCQYTYGAGGSRDINITGARLRKGARGEGWVVSKPGGKDYCSECKEREVGNG